MEILHTSLEQWAGTSPIAITNHDFHDMAQYTAYLKNVQSKAALRMYDSEPFLNDWLSSHYAYLSLCHMHTDFIEITYVHSGAGVAVLNDTKRMIQKGDIVCVQLGDQHANYPLPSFSVYNCLVSSRLLEQKGLLFESVVDESGRFQLPGFSTLEGNTLLQIEDLFETMQAEYNQKQLGYESLLLYYFNQLLVLLYRSIRESKGRHNRVMAPILDYVAEHYRSITLDQLATFSSYTAPYLSRLFRETLGVNFTEYVNRLRIEEAIKLIMQSSFSIEDIGRSVGFKNKLHFYEVFKKHTGFTPGTLRKPR